MIFNKFNNLIIIKEEKLCLQNFLLRSGYLMIEERTSFENSYLEKQRINISAKRQITIPSKYYHAMGLDKEIDCIYSNDMLILKPVRNDDSAFAEEILADLINRGYSGERLLIEYKKINEKIRPAVEKLIEEADKIAKTASENYTDPTDDIFGTDKTEV